MAGGDRRQSAPWCGSRPHPSPAARSPWPYGRTSSRQLRAQGVAGDASDAQLVVDELEALVHVGLGLVHVLLEQHGSHELEHLGLVVQKRQLLTRRPQSLRLPLRHHQSTDQSPHLLHHGVLVGLLRELLPLRRQRRHLCRAAPGVSTGYLSTSPSRGHALVKRAPHPPAARGSAPSRRPPGPSSRRSARGVGSNSLGPRMRLQTDLAATQAIAECCQRNAGPRRVGEEAAINHNEAARAD